MKPSILFLDIETAPDVVWTWGVYQANAISVKEHWYVLCFAAKWRGDKNILVRGLDDYPGYEGGNSTEDQLLDDVWQLLDEADIVVAHNGADFDVKKLNARFIDNGMKPPSPYKVVDTKRDLVQVAKYSSHRLDWLSKQLGFGAKIATDFSLWEGCMKGDTESWRTMKKYNAHDIDLLEKLYNELSPWIKQPNATLYGEYRNVEGCVNPACDGGKLIKRGLTYAETRVYQLYRCNKCGKQARSVKSESGTKVRGV